MNTHMTLRNNKSIGFVTAFLLHGALFAFSGLVFVKPVEYAVELGDGGIEVNLTAAPAEPVSTSEVAQELPKPVQQETVSKDPDNIPLPQYDIEEQKLLQKMQEEKKQIQTAVDPTYKGDGSSPIPGKDATTFYSSGGAVTEAKPNYLRNPAPPYPLEAREKGWQGVVILRVLVDKTGYTIKVDKEKSSGYDILDESALKTVKSWRFRPAQLGALPVESLVRIPIRFELENLRKNKT